MLISEYGISSISLSALKSITVLIFVSFNNLSNCGIGSTVKIQGKHFTGTTSVKIGGTNVASYTIDSDTSITAIVGNVSIGRINVITPLGTATSNDSIVTNCCYWNGAINNAWALAYCSSVVPLPMTAAQAALAMVLVRSAAGPQFVVHELNRVIKLFNSVLTVLASG